MPTLPRMSSAAIRDLMPADLPEVVMPACKARPVLKGQTAIVPAAALGYVITGPTQAGRVGFSI